MSGDIQKETKRIHQGIVESLAFSEALAKRDAEIERLRDDRDSWADQADARVEDCERFIEEIERLRLSHLETEKELERLRGLLRVARDDVVECANRETKPHRIYGYRRQLAEIDEALGE